jgi:enediyne biosynthesis protein E4
MITRRKMIITTAGAAGTAMIGGVSAAFGQGISSRGVKAQPRGKPFGRPFLAQLTDVAKQAGLTQPVIYGGVDSKSYILEVVGAGVAFIDYDNDGWVDIFVLSGTRLEGDSPGATNRLYKNNREWHVHRCNRQGWADSYRVGVCRDRGRL